MRRLSTFASRLWNDERGASMVEYAVLTALITSALVGAIGFLTGAIQTRLTELTGLIDGINN